MPRWLQVALAPGQAWHRPKARANLEGDEEDFKNNQAKRTSAKSGMLLPRSRESGRVKGIGECSARSLNKLQISRVRAQMRRAPCYVCRVDLINDLRAASGAARAIELCAIRFQ